MTRYVYAFDTSESAMSAVEYLGGNGLDGKRVSLVARGDINKNELPDSLVNVSMDFAPSVKRGIAIGAATGLAIGIIVPLIPAVGISLNPFELIAFLIGGALIGAWSASLIGASVPNSLRRKFKDEIEAGHTLVVIDTDGVDDARIVGSMANAANRHLVWQSDSNRVPEVAA
ncbi:MAG: hypothetical protein ABJB01_13445 [Rudaea sp.]